MLSILLAGGVALTVTLLGTPLFIRFLVAKQYGQFIRQDGPTSHQIKRGTPTMGGVMIILGTVLGYAFGNGVTGRPPDVSGLLLLFLMVGLGFIGFLDDSAKIRHRQSLGLTPWMKIVGQGLIGITFAVLALRFRNNQNRAPASTRISVLRDSGLDLAFAGTALGLVLFIAWANFLITAWSNAVNLTDGLDGLAAGVATIASVTICLVALQQGYALVAVLTAALAGAAIGFLFYNFNPAKIFMGDTGSMFLGFMLAGISVVGAVKSAATIALIVPILALGLPILDTTFAIVRRARNHRPIFKPDKGHLHHRLLAHGFSQKQAVLLMYVVSALFGLCALALTAVSIQAAALIILLVAAAVFVGARKLGILGMDAPQK